MSDSLKPAYIEKVDQRRDFIVWIVDGSYIRGHIDKEFTNFGQHYRYDYIPLKEFWIDKEALHDEREFFIQHLLTEYDLMSKGVSYDQALPEADGLNWGRFRNRPQSQSPKSYGLKLSLLKELIYADL